VAISSTIATRRLVSRSRNVRGGGAAGRVAITETIDAPIA